MRCHLLVSVKARKGYYKMAFDFDAMWRAGAWGSMRCHLLASGKTREGCYKMAFDFGAMRRAGAGVIVLCLG